MLSWLKFFRDSSSHNYQSLISIFVGVMILFIGTILFAQPDTLWTRTFGGNHIDWGYSVQQTTDSGYIIIGSTDSYDASPGDSITDVWLIKTDANGDTLWTRVFGGSGLDVGNSVQQTTDGGYIIAGSVEQTLFDDDVWLIKTDANGDTLWTRIFGVSDLDRGYSVQQTTDGGYIITGIVGGDWGSTKGDVWLIKTDANGDTLWTRTFGGNPRDVGYSVQQTTDGGYIITGETYSYGAGSYDIWLIKTDANGDTLWTRTFGGTYSEGGRSVQQTTDGGYIITGNYGYPVWQVYTDVWLIKTNANGDTLWTRKFGGGNDYAKGHSVQQTTDGGYIIIGETRTQGAGWFDGWLIKTDANGNKQWDKFLGGSLHDRLHSVQQTTDGGYIIAGGTRSYSGDYGGDVWLIKTDAVGVEESVSLIPKKFFVCQNYPNPINYGTYIEYALPKATNVAITVYTLTGRVIRTLFTGTQNPGTYKVFWDGRDDSGKKVASGIYFYHIEAGSLKATRKLTIIR